MFALMWRVLTRPALTLFEQARGEANIGRAVTFTFVIGVCFGALRGFIHWFFSSHPAAEIITLAIMTAFGLVASIFIAQAFLFSAARALGGRGDFAAQIFLSSLVFAPLNALAMSADVFQDASALIVFAALAYNILLLGFALRATHGGADWRIPNIVLFALSFIGVLIGWLVLATLPE